MSKTNTIEEIAQKHYRTIFSYCLSILMNREMAEDACHDVFIKAQAHIDKLYSSKNSLAWLLRVARNHCYDIIRKEKRSFTGIDLENLLVENSAGPEDRLLAKEQLSSVIRAIAGLDPMYREIVILRDIDGLSYREVGAHLGIDNKKVKWMLHTARQNIKRVVGGIDENAEIPKHQADIEKRLFRTGT